MKNFGRIFFTVCSIFVIFSSLEIAMAGGVWQPSYTCNRQTMTPYQYNQCILFNKNSDHYKRLHDELNRMENTIKKPLQVPQGVRPPQQQYQQYQQYQRYPQYQQYQQRYQPYVK